MTSVRPGRPADRPTIRRLQTHLPDPAPELLDHGLRTGGVLVSEGGTGVPVGYLLAVGVTFGRLTGTGASPPPPETSGGRGPPETADPPEAPDARGTDGRTGAHLAELVIAPGFRREGRARTLLDRLFAATDGPITVAVAPENEAARGLYRSAGFERIGRREEYFASGPALWLVRR